jgi:predicted SAM-dependent methyltransferase
MNTAFTQGLKSGKLCYRGKQEFEAGWRAATNTQNAALTTIIDHSDLIDFEILGNPFDTILHEHLWALYE